MSAHALHATRAGAASAAARVAGRLGLVALTASAVRAGACTLLRSPLQRSAPAFTAGDSMKADGGLSCRSARALAGAKSRRREAACGGGAEIYRPTDDQEPGTHSRRGTAELPTAPAA